MLAVILTSFATLATMSWAADTTEKDQCETFWAAGTGTIKFPAFSYEEDAFWLVRDPESDSIVLEREEAVGGNVTTATKIVVRDYPEIGGSKMLKLLSGKRAGVHAHITTCGRGEAQTMTIKEIVLVLLPDRKSQLASAPIVP